MGLGERVLGGGGVVEGLLGAGLAERVAELRDLLVGDGVPLAAELAPGPQPPLAVELFAVLVGSGRVGQGGHGRQEGRHGGDLRVEVFPFGAAVCGGGEGGHRAGGVGDVPLVVETSERRVVFRHRAEVLHREGGFAAIRFGGLGRRSWCAYWGSFVGVLLAPLSTKIEFDVVDETGAVVGCWEMLVVGLDFLPQRCWCRGFAGRELFQCLVVRSDLSGFGTHRSIVSARRKEVGRFSLDIFSMLETSPLLFLTGPLRTLSSGARRAFRLAGLQRLKTGVVDKPLGVGVYRMTGCFISESVLNFAPECFGLPLLLLVFVERHGCGALSAVSKQNRSWTRSGWQMRKKATVI